MSTTTAIPAGATDSRDATATWTARSAPWIALGLVAVAAALRLSQIHQSLVGDEVFTYQDIAGHSFGTVLTTVHAGGENSPPLFFLMAWLTAKLGDATVWLRLPSVLLGSATVFVVYELGRMVFTRAAGLVAAGVIALAPFTVFYGIEGRPYASMTFFVALSTLAVVQAVRTRAWPWWLLYVVCSAAAAYTHYTCVFVLGVQALWSIWACRAPDDPGLVGLLSGARDAVAANILIVLLYLPWLPHLRGKALAVIGGLYPLTASRVLADLLRPIPGHPSAPLGKVPTLAGLIVMAVIVVAGSVAVLRRHPRVSLSQPGFLIVLLMAATPVGLLLYSVLDTDLWLPRGLSASIPAAALVLGVLITALPRTAAIAAVIATATILIFGTVRSLGPDYNRGPFRDVAAYLDQQGNAHSPIVLGTFAGAGPLLVESRKGLTVVTSPALWSHIPAGGTGFIVLDQAIARIAHLSLAAPPGFALVGHRHWGGWLPIDVWVYRHATGG